MRIGRAIFGLVLAAAVVLSLSGVVRAQMMGVEGKSTTMAKDHSCCKKTHEQEKSPVKKGGCDGQATCCCVVVSTPAAAATTLIEGGRASEFVLIYSGALDSLTHPDAVFHPPRA